MHKYLLTEAEIIKAANLANLIQEGEELIAIFVTLVKKVKDKGGRGKFKDGRGKAEELRKGEDQEKYRNGDCKKFCVNPS